MMLIASIVVVFSAAAHAQQWDAAETWAQLDVIAEVRRQHRFPQDVVLGAEKILEWGEGAFFEVRRLNQMPERRWILWRTNNRTLPVPTSYAAFEGFLRFEVKDAQPLTTPQEATIWMKRLLALAQVRPDAYGDCVRKGEGYVCPRRQAVALGRWPAALGLTSAGRLTPATISK